MTPATVTRFTLVGALVMAVLVPPTGSAVQTPPQQIVAEARAQFPAGLNTPLDLASFLRAVVGRLNAEGVPGGPFGLLVKTSGSNCLGYSCDVICSGQGFAQRQWDVLIDSGGASIPTWREVGPGQTVRPCELAGTFPPPPPPPPPGCGWPDQRVEVAQLRDTVAVQARHVADLDTELARVTTERDTARRERDEARQALEDCRVKPAGRCTFDWRRFTCRLIP